MADSSSGRVVRAYVNKFSSTLADVIYYLSKLRILTSTPAPLGRINQPKSKLTQVGWSPGAGRAVFARLTPLPAVRVQDSGGDINAQGVGTYTRIDSWQSWNSHCDLLKSRFLFVFYDLAQR